MGELLKKGKGRIKQAVAALTGDGALREEGEKEEREGKVEAAVADVKHAVKGAVRDAKHAVKEITK